MRYSTGGKAVLFLGAAAIVVSTAAAASAQRRRDATPNATLPLATDIVAANPDRYYGTQVTLSAGVVEILTKTAFTVDQKRVTGAKQTTTVGKPILVIAPTLNGSLDRKNYMLFVGELVKFDAAVIAQKLKGYQLDLTPDLFPKYQDRPVLLATAVYDYQSIDQAKRPMSAEEVALSAVMKRIAPAFAALRKGVDASDRAVVVEHAATLKQAFAQSEPFWKERPDAMQWAENARELAAAIETNAPAGKWEAVKLGADTLNLRCQTCHGAYRDRLDDGTYRIKMGK